jgi:hypothetical protein
MPDKIKKAKFKKGENMAVYEDKLIIMKGKDNDVSYECHLW